MLILKGFQFTEIIHQDAKTAVYRGIRMKDRRPVMAKAFKDEYPLLAEIIKLEREFELMKEVGQPGVIGLHSLEKVGRQKVLIMEDMGGRPLKEVMGGPADIRPLLETVIAVTAILDRIHRHNIVHQDIKPSNILFNPDTGEVQIVDFSTAARVQNGICPAVIPERMEGPPAYISPEQTGRMNRPVDFRSDLYSLGVTFYELLAGRLPFDGRDPMELIHAHIARQPVPPDVDRRIPGVVCRIVMKLLSKMAEDRYQSASGLRADLETCLNKLDKADRIEPFEIGRKDSTGRFRIPEKMYGREEEKGILRDEYDRVARGDFRIALVTGPSGIGKTRLVNEFEKQVLGKNGYFASGKCDFLKGDIPYNGLISGFKDLTNQLLTLPPEKLEGIKVELVAALGESGQLLVDMIPELELIVGRQKPLPELGTQDLKERFNLTCRRFVGVFAKAEHPLVFFVDDMQWADPDSLALMRYVVGSVGKGYLLLLGAFQDRNMDPSHPATKALNQLFEKQAQDVALVEVKSLAVSDIDRLVSDVLSCGSNASYPLSEMIERKTGGNPFSINQFLQALHRREILRFDRDSSSWTWDMERVGRMEFSDNVIDLLVEIVGNLPDETRRLIQSAACLGDGFDLARLARVAEISLPVAVQRLHPAVAEGLVLPRVDPSRDFDSVDYRFSHNRVRQAAYLQLEKNERRKVHLNIGRLLLTDPSRTELDDSLFKVVEHLNAGRELLKESSQKLELAALNLKACRKAGQAAALESASEYAGTGIELLPADGWKAAYETTFDLHIEYAGLESYLGHDETSDAIYEKMLSRAGSDLDRLKIFCHQAHSVYDKGRLQKVFELVASALELCGIEAPKTDNQILAALELETERLDAQLTNLNPSDLLDLTETTDTKQVFLTKLLVGPASTAIFFLRMNRLSAFISFKAFNLTLQHGKCEYTPLVLLNYAINEVVELRGYRRAYEFGRLAMELSDRYDNIQVGNEIYLRYYTFIHHWKRPLTEKLGYLYRIFDTAVEIGSFFTGLTASRIIVGTETNCGKNLEQIYRNFKKRHAVLKTINPPEDWDDMINGQQLRLLLGLTESKTTFDDENFNEEEFLKSNTDDEIAFKAYYYAKLRCAYILEDRERWIDYADKALETLPLFHSGVSVYPEGLFFACLTFLAECSTAGRQKIEEYLNRVGDMQIQMKVWADICEANYLHKYLLIEAERARVRDRDVEAMRLYDRAIESARKHGYINNQAIANELAAKYYLSREIEKVAAMYMKEAHYLFGLWGAAAKTRDLEEKYPRLVSVVASDSPPSTSGGSFSTNLDLNTIIKAARTISSEIVREKLVGKLLEIMIENAGAQKGVLLLKKENELFIEAEGLAKESKITYSRSPLETRNRIVPETVVSYVNRTRKLLVLDDALDEHPFSEDPYIKENRSRSVLCMPVTRLDRLTAILYLENPLVAGAFTDERQETLKILCSQASVSVENADLFEELNSLRNQLVNIVNSMPSILVGVDTNGRITQWNQEAEKETGTTGDMVRGLLLADVYPQLAAEMENVRKAIESRKTVKASRVLEQADDRMRFLDIAVFPLVNNGVEGAVIRVDDVSERVRIEEMMIQSEKMLSLGGLAAGMAHEINNPLAAIIQSMQVIRNRVTQDIEKNKKVAEECGTTLESITRYMERRGLLSMMDSVSDIGNRAAHLVKNMLGFSRKSDLLFGRHNLGELLDRTVELAAQDYNLKKKYDFRHIEILREYDPSLPEVPCDSSKMQQVFLNILTNGSQAMTQSVEAGKAPRFVLRIEGEDDMARIEIEDNGPGMDEEVRKRIFEPFFTTKEVGIGTGLGLSVSYFIVTDTHHGTINVDSIPGWRTTFVIRLPMIQAEKRQT